MVVWRKLWGFLSSFDNWESEGSRPVRSLTGLQSENSKFREKVEFHVDFSHVELSLVVVRYISNERIFPCSRRTFLNTSTIDSFSKFQDHAFLFTSLSCFHGDLRTEAENDPITWYAPKRTRMAIQLLEKLEMLRHLFDGMLPSALNEDSTSQEQAAHYISIYSVDKNARGLVFSLGGIDLCGHVVPYLNKPF